MARLRFEAGPFVLLLEDGIDALLLWPEVYAARLFTLELRDSSGDLVNILENAYDILYSRSVNEAPELAFNLPADDSKASGITRANEIWLRDYAAGTVIEKFILNIRQDVR